MKRKSFIFSISALVSIILSPIKLLASRIKKGIKVETEQDRFGKELSLLEGDKFYTKVSSSDSDGDLFIFESTRDKKGGTNFHVHYDQDEWWYIVSGEFLFKVGDETFTAKAGDSVFGPRMVPHVFSKTSDGIAKMLIGFQPAGKMETYFKKISEGAAKNMTDPERQNFRKEHGFEMVGPALDYQKN